MSRLIKAEWYRFTHANSFVFWLLIICLVNILLQYSVDFNLLNYNLEEFMNGYIQSVGFMSIQMFVPVFVAVIVGFGYMRKTAYYEVMAGNKLSHIILSKVVVDAFVVAGCVFLSFLILPTIIGIKNGLGGAENIILRAALLLVIFLHTCISAVLMTTAIRHFVAAMAIYLRLAVADGAFFMLICTVADVEGEAPTWLNVIGEWFVMNQFNTVFVGEITKRAVLGIFGSMLVECLILYVISLIGMKKKKYL